jgi:hypothetical protein
MRSALLFDYTSFSALAVEDLFGNLPVFKDVTAFVANDNITGCPMRLRVKRTKHLTRKLPMKKFCSFAVIVVHAQRIAKDLFV